MVIFATVFEGVLKTTVGATRVGTRGAMVGATVEAGTELLLVTEVGWTVDSRVLVTQALFSQEVIVIVVVNSSELVSVDVELTGAVVGSMVDLPDELVKVSVVMIVLVVVGSTSEVELLDKVSVEVKVRVVVESSSEVELFDKVSVEVKVMVVVESDSVVHGSVEVSSSVVQGSVEVSASVEVEVSFSVVQGSVEVSASVSVSEVSVTVKVVVIVVVVSSSVDVVFGFLCLPKASTSFAKTVDDKIKAPIIVENFILNPKK